MIIILKCIGLMYYLTFFLIVQSDHNFLFFMNNYASNTDKLDEIVLQINFSFQYLIDVSGGKTHNIYFFKNFSNGNFNVLNIPLEPYFNFIEIVKANSIPFYPFCITFTVGVILFEIGIEIWISWKNNELENLLNIVNTKSIKWPKYICLVRTVIMWNGLLL